MLYRIRNLHHLVAYAAPATYFVAATHFAAATQKLKLLESFVHKMLSINNLLLPLYTSQITSVTELAFIPRPPNCTI